MKRKLPRSKVMLILIPILLLFSCKDDERIYELLPSEPEPEMDITAYGTISVNHENGSGASGNEGSLKVVDGDYNSKFLINPYVSDLYMQLSFPGGAALSAYTLTSGNDSPDRDPKKWTLTASNDGENWIELDSRTDQVFAERNLTVRYDFDNIEKFKIYRLNILSNGGGSLFQLSEWRIISVPVNEPN